MFTHTRSLFALFMAVGLVAVGGCTHSPSAAHDAASDHEKHDSLPLPKRLAFMTGHVEAGLALYRAGEPTMAAQHLEHPVSETHASERVGLDALGFDAERFIAVSNALAKGLKANEIEPQLLAAQQNLAMVSTRAGGDTTEVIDFLLDTIVEEYAIGVQGGAVTDPGEYQDAFGFTVVAINRAQDYREPKRSRVIDRLKKLLATWPSAPVPPANPAPPQDINRLVDDVRSAL
ncbi:MAG: hypothetical protein AAF465_07030 [Pseudomonadota bacterium]